MMHINNQHFFRCFILTFLLFGWAFSGYQSLNALDEGELRVFAYDLRYEYTDNPDTELGTYTFYFKSNVPATSGKLIFYHGKTINYTHDIKDGETVIGQDTVWKDSIVGEYQILQPVINARTADGQYSFQLKKDEIPIDATKKNAYLGMTWAIELTDNTIIGKYPNKATDHLESQPSNDNVADDKNYDLKSYLWSLEDDEHALYYQVRKPRLLMEDNKLRCPQGIAIDNNPHSPFFGRVYVANPPSPSDPQDAYDAGIIVYEPDPENPAGAPYRKLGDGKTAYMPTNVTFPTNDGNTRFFMHRIAVNPVNGNVYYCNSASSVPSAIYQLIPDPTSVLTDNGAINVTSTLITEDNKDSSPIHPINSLAFGPGGELYVMSRAGGDCTIKSGGGNSELEDDEYEPGNGVIYKLEKTNDDYIYDNAVKHYNPKTNTLYGTTINTVTQYGFPYCISPWVSPDNTMVVNARGGFWVSQYRAEKIDAYSFLAHIHPEGFKRGETPGTSLQRHFQFSMGAGCSDTYSGNNVAPLWTTRQLLEPHTQDSRVETNHPNPCGQVAIYEKNGMNSTEAWLAVGFSERVCVFKLFYRTDPIDWFGFNLDWMFEIPIEGATKIDGLAFDYAGNLFIASSTTHSLYIYSLPNYDAMQPYGSPRPQDIPAVQPMIFDNDGHRQLEVIHSGNTTNTTNNLNRGNPLDDNSVITPARFDLTVDGAIVYDEKYNNSFDTQWSTTDNWNIKRVPDSTDIPVVIRSNAVLDEQQSVSGMTIENNSQLTIAHDGGLTIGEGGIKGASKKGVLTLENFSAIWGSEHYANRGAGYLRIHPSVTDMPKVTVHYRTKAQPSDTDPEENAHRLWQYVGAPGKGTIATSTSTTSLYQWKESEGGWVKKTDTTPMKPFVEGYAITQDGAPDYFWTTTAINDNQSIPLSYTEGVRRNEGDEEPISGQNVIANSYLAPINVAAFVESDFTGNIERTFYLFNTGSWTEWNNAKETPYVDLTAQDQSSGHYTAIPVFGSQNFDEVKDPTFIPPMSGIFVRTGSGEDTIKFNYERLVWSWADSNEAANNPMHAPSRVAGQSQQTYAPELLRRIRIQAYGEGSGSDRMYIMQDTRCTSGYDNGWDGENMHAAGQVNIYTNEPCGKMEVSCSNSIDSMYIGFCAGADTIYTLRFTSLIGDSLYIKDLENDSIIALAEEGTYTFHAPAMSVNDMRFQVQLNPEFPAGHPNGNGNSGTTTAIDNVSSSKVWISDNIVYVSTGQEENIVVLCNMHGQVLYQHPFDYQTQLSMAGLPAGVYLMKINNEIYKYVLQ